VAQPAGMNGLQFGLLEGTVEIICNFYVGMPGQLGGGAEVADSALKEGPDVGGNGGGGI